MSSKKSPLMSSSKKTSVKKTTSIKKPSGSKKKQADEEVIIPLLARRSCHLPGNDWKEDWIQFMRNNHIVFGICLCHPLHPLEWWERIMALIGSISIGLIATNIAYIWDDYDHQTANESLIHVWGDNFVITKGMVFLWTFGAILHSTYDLLVWNVMACACCHPGGKWGNEAYSRRVKDCGSFAMIPVVLFLALVAAIAVMRRASDRDQDTSTSYAQDGGDVDATATTETAHWKDSIFWNDIDGLQSFSFLSKYAIELALTWFVFFPLVGTIMFSGILGCGGRLPVLGGRPRDMRLYKESMAKERNDSYTYWEV